MPAKLDRVRPISLQRTPGAQLRKWIGAARVRILAAREDPPTLCRWATHLAIVGLGVAALVTIRAPRAVVQPTPEPTAALLPTAAPRGGARSGTARGGGYLVRAAVPLTSDPANTPGQAQATPSPTAAPKMTTYVVQPGDTVIALAERYGITPDTILSANPALAGNPDLLRLGQELVIPGVSGVLHVVQAGDTLNAIAARYQVTVDVILSYADNNLTNSELLYPGQKLVIPGGVWPHKGADTSSTAVAATGLFIWPTKGTISQRPWSLHMAVDIAASTGTPIYASDAGTVAESGWTNVGYGQYVLIDHGNGYRTLYAHMSQRLVAAGQKVAKGQKIGLVGSTGNSTGPHLHFEIYRNGVIQNPLAYLP